jgi:hypothetical protein
MSRVATDFPTLIFGTVFLSCFIILFVGSVSPNHLDISPGNTGKFGFGKFLSLSSLLFLGHGVLLSVHVLCRLAIHSRHLDISFVEVPQGRPEGGIWRLLDSAIFPTSVATRSWTRSPAITSLSQFRSFQRDRITDTNAAILLFFSAAGLICFYTGARASSAFLVGMYITAFIVVNLFKTTILLWSNKASCAKVSEDSLPKYPIGGGMSSFSANRVLCSLLLSSTRHQVNGAHIDPY